MAVSGPLRKQIVSPMRSAEKLTSPKAPARAVGWRTFKEVKFEGVPDRSISPVNCNSPTISRRPEAYATNSGQTHIGVRPISRRPAEEKILGISRKAATRSDERAGGASPHPYCSELEASLHKSQRENEEGTTD